MFALKIKCYFHLISTNLFPTNSHQFEGAIEVLMHKIGMVSCVKRFLTYTSSLIYSQPSALLLHT